MLPCPPAAASTLFLLSLLLPPATVADVATAAAVQGAASETTTATMDDDDAAARRAPNDATPNNDNDASSSCALYLAPSSIPNSGLGTYTAHPLRPHIPIGHPELLHNLIDLPHHSSPRQADSSVLADYDWTAFDYHAHLEGRKVQTLIPGLGAAINGHPGLHNTMAGLPDSMFSSARVVAATTAAGGGTTTALLLDRHSDAASGAVTYYSNLTTYSTTSIPAGSELFAHYSDQYFADRVHTFGSIPLAEDYAVADTIVRRFVDFTEDNESRQDRLSEGAVEDLWAVIVNSLGKPGSSNGNDDEGSGDDAAEIVEDEVGDRAEEEEEEELDIDTTIRLRAALQPISISDLRRAAEVGTASSSLPNSVRSLPWLETHGRCLTDVRPGSSSIPHAGRGAFATRYIERGSVVLPMPVLQINRTLLDMHELRSDPRDSTGERMIKSKKATGRQLLLNYCFGHPQSSVLLWPYSSMSNYVNHAPSSSSSSPPRDATAEASQASSPKAGLSRDTGLEANVVLRWNADGFGDGYHHTEWLDDDAEAVLSRAKAGLMLELVAARDIAGGEEVLLDYGESWARAWEEHVERWVELTSRKTGGSDGSSSSLWDDYVYPHVFDKDLTVRTQTEQMVDPYPPNVRTACYHIDDEEGGRDSRTVNLGGKEAPLMGRIWKEPAADRYGSQQAAALRFCKVLERNAVDGNSSDGSTSEGEGEGGGSEEESEERYLYTVVLETDDGQGQGQGKRLAANYRVLFDVPRHAIKFVDAPYMSDQHLAGTFRHEIGVPDGVFPEAWMDLR